MYIYITYTIFRSTNFKTLLKKAHRIKRSSSSKMVRTPSFDHNGIKRGAWSEDEDNKLRTYIQTHGHPNWRELPKFAGLARCGKSCRLRWMNYLRPNVKRGGFTKEEEDVIVRVHKKLGNKWSKMAALLPGRSDNEIKNHWHTHLKTRFYKDHTAVSKNQQSGNNERRPSDVSPNFYERQLINPTLKTPTEVEILVAVLSADHSATASSSSTSGSSLSVSDYAAPQMSDDFGNYWVDSFLQEEGSIIPCLGLGDDLISEDSLQDYIIDDGPLW